MRLYVTVGEGLENRGSSYVLSVKVKTIIHVHAYILELVNAYHHLYFPRILADIEDNFQVLKMEKDSYFLTVSYRIIIIIMQFKVVLAIQRYRII